jgi:integrase
VKKPPGPSLLLVGGIWHVRFQRAGVRIQRSTKETSRSRADVVAWEMFCGEGPVPTLAVLSRSWLETHESTTSPEHWRSVREFSKNHLYALGEMRVDRIRTEDAEGARAKHLRGRAPATANLWLRILKLLCNWAVKRNLMPKVPWRVKMLRLQKKPRVILPLAKACAWLDAVDVVAGGRKGIALAIRLMLGLGLRESEALTARWEWIDWERRTYTPGFTKGREAVPLPVPKWLVDHLKPLHGPRRRRMADRPRRAVRRQGLIVESPRGGSYAPGATREVIAKANRVVGVEGLTPHRLRGTFATLQSEAGVPVQDIQRAMRHKDARTTLGYCEVDMERVAKAQEEIARRMGLPWRKNGNPQEVNPPGPSQ